MVVLLVRTGRMEIMFRRWVPFPVGLWVVACLTRSRESSRPLRSDLVLCRSLLPLWGQIQTRIAAWGAPSGGFSNHL